MPKKKINLSEDFISKLFEISAGYFPAGKFDELLSLIEKEAALNLFTYEAESNLLRIIQSSYDKITFLNDLIKYPHHVEIVTAIAVNSNYLSDILIRSPEYFYWAANPSHLKEKLELKSFKDSLEDITSKYKTIEAKVNSLRRIKRKEILRIGLRDILKQDELTDTTEQLSILAEAISSGLFNVCYKEILNKYSIEGLAKEYCIAALGKLGGNELNYSSDIDLIIFYDSNEPVKGNKFYNEILTEAIYLFIESAVSITGAGYIYRIDFRLRPDGRTAQLTRTIQEYLNYYESRGEDWERQMLIKSRFAGGSENLYNMFMNYLQPFIYPSSFAVSPTEQIKSLKINIEKGLTGDKNIKLVPGGIRDIEFSVQALQLLNGGRIKEIRTGNTLEAINLLEKNNLLTKKEAADFKQAYTLYRKIEHYLQLMSDKQTHTIPADGEMLEKLSFFLGFKSSKEFNKEIKKRREAVIRIYNSIMGIEDNEAKLSALNVKLENKQRAEKDLEFLREGKGILGQKQFDSKSISLFKKIEPALINYLNNSIQPDAVLQNFSRIIRHAHFPSIWYNEFLDGNFFNSFLELCGFSQKAVDLFAEDKELREFFLSRKAFDDLPLETGTKFFLFALIVQFTLDIISAAEVSFNLSRFFYKKIDEAASQSLTKKIIKEGYFIAGLGSFGSGEMTFNSDVDLIFCVKDVTLFKDVQKDFQKLLQKIKDELKPFEVDCRLRPEGKSSNLVGDLNGYKKYIQTRMRIWEFQSLTRINFISGDEELFNSFLKMIKKKIAVFNHDEIKKEIYEMRRKLYTQSVSANIFNLKKNPGGITDIEFLIQYLILCNPALFDQCRGEETEKVIDNLTGFSEEYIELKKLKENFSFLKKLYLTNQNIFNTSSSLLSMESKKIKLLSAKIGFENEAAFKKYFSELIKQNNILFTKYLK